MALPNMKIQEISDESLENWRAIGRGGFGSVYKVWHKRWGFDVAIKLLHYDDGSSPVKPIIPTLATEAENMETAVSPFVLLLLGHYQGCPPGMGLPRREGLVMQFMERGSVRSLQRALGGPPPWALAFRLVHQVALGMNFLHQTTPPLLHRDLKPDNVLLDNDLNAKLADFGLSRYSCSVVQTSSSIPGELMGSLAYMPPEAFGPNCKPRRSYDVYSYGILLWSILSGEEPYPGALPSVVQFRIPMGDRPLIDRIDPGKAQGLGELVGLMVNCWDKDPNQRPSFSDCVKLTSSVYSKHETGIRQAVDEAIKKMESVNATDSSDSQEMTSLNDPSPGVSMNVSDRTKDEIVKHPTKQGSPATQDCPDAKVNDRKMNDEEKAAFIDKHSVTLIQNVTMVMAILDDLPLHPEMYAKIAAEKTSHAQIRLLLREPLHSGGVKVKAAFYSALKKHEPHLTERLGG